ERRRDATEGELAIGAERAPGRGRVVLCVERQVGERPIHRGARGGGIRVACRVRVEDAAAVRAAVPAADAFRVTWKLAVLERAEDVDRIGQTGRGVNVLVVPTLPRAEVKRGVVGARGSVRRQLLPAVVGRGERVAGGGRLGGSRRLRGEQSRGRLVGVVRPPELRRHARAPGRSVRQVYPRLPVLDGRGQ